MVAGWWLVVAGGWWWLVVVGGWWFVGGCVAGGWWLALGVWCLVRGG